MPRELTVKKYGGTSLGSLQKIQAIARILAKDFERGELPLVVVSAMSGETARLIEMAGKIHPRFRGRAYDLLLSSGEQVSLSLLSMALERRGLKTAPLLAMHAGIRTDALFSEAKIQSIDTGPIQNILREKDRIPLVAGFQGMAAREQITTLGRGGSDLTAVALAVAFQRKICEIYTDVAGIYTADPRIVPDARLKRRVGFSEMMEMSSLGAKALQCRAVELAAKHNVRIHIRHAFKKGRGALIGEDFMESALVSAVAHDLNVLVLRLKDLPKGPLLASRIFQALGQAGVSVDIISQQTDSKSQRISFSIARESLEKAKEAVRPFVPKGGKIQAIKGVAKVSIVGAGMGGHSGVAGRFFSVFERLNAHFFLITTSEIKISAIVKEKRLKEIAQALHDEFQLSKPRRRRSLAASGRRQKRA